MANITIYTTRTCPYCYTAKSLLTKKGLPFDEIDVSGDPAARQRMMPRQRTAQRAADFHWRDSCGRQRGAV